MELDDPNIVCRILPELGEQQVLEGYSEDDEPILVPQASLITVRMLMNHTAGEYNVQCILYTRSQRVDVDAR